MFTESQHGLLVTDNSLQRSLCTSACAVSDPDLEIREGSPPNFLRPFGLQFGQKITKGPSSPGPSPGSVTDVDGDKEPFSVLERWECSVDNFY